MKIQKLKEPICSIRNNVKNRRILTMTGSLCILSCIFLSLIIGLFINNLTYYGFLLSITYGLIIALKVLIVAGYNKYSENLRAQKNIYIIVGIMLILLGQFSTYTYLYMFSHNILSKFPVWIVCIQLTYSVFTFIYSVVKFFIGKKTLSPLDKLFWIISAVARILTLIISINAILGLAVDTKNKWYILEQGALFTASIFGFGIYTLAASRSIKKTVAT